MRRGEIAAFDTSGRLVAGRLYHVNELLDRDLPPSAAFRLGRIRDKMVGEVERFQRDHRALLEAFGAEADETGRLTLPGDADMEAFAEEYAELASEEVDLGLTIRLEAFGDVPVPGASLAALDGIVVEETA